MASTIVRSPYPDVTIPDVSLPALVFADVARRAGKPALIDGPTGRTITYGELAGGARLVAGGLAAHGFGKGEVFANLPIGKSDARPAQLAADGVSCTLCHQITPDKFGTRDSFVGRFVLNSPAPGAPRTMFGPYEVKPGRVTGVG